VTSLIIFIILFLCIFKIRLPDANPITHTFAATDPLSKVYEFVAGHRPPGSVFKLMTAFPRKVLEGGDLSKNLKELSKPIIILVIITVIFFFFSVVVFI